MTRKALARAINKILRDERVYAASLQAGGEYGRAKLAWAAIQGVKEALGSVAGGEDATYAERLLGALEEQRASYLGLWEDEDGVGTSTFARILDEVDMSS